MFFVVVFDSCLSLFSSASLTLKVAVQACPQSGCGNSLRIWTCFEWSPLSLILSGVSHVLWKCLKFREMLLLTPRFKVLLELVAEGSFEMF